VGLRRPWSSFQRCSDRHRAVRAEPVEGRNGRAKDTPPLWRERRLDRPTTVQPHARRNPQARGE
jgi:hypothetical protein